MRLPAESTNNESRGVLCFLSSPTKTALAPRRGRLRVASVNRTVLRLVGGSNDKCWGTTALFLFMIFFDPNIWLRAVKAKPRTNTCSAGLCRCVFLSEYIFGKGHPEQFVQRNKHRLWRFRVCTTSAGFEKSILSTRSLTENVGGLFCLCKNGKIVLFIYYQFSLYVV